ncbi:MAG: DUF2799 domain-containing protein [Caulobacter sp.]|nr:DUF2799 domain-containing protein [Caulobacter sp.]
MSEDQCLTGDWGGIGYSDGAAGYTVDRLGAHRQACAKHGVVPNEASYMTGRARGLTIYCTPPSGFRAGRNGNTYGGVCPTSLERPFLAAYGDGRMVYDVQQRINRARSEISTAEQTADSVDRQMREAEEQLKSPTLTNDEKRAIRERLKRLRDERYSADEDRRQALYARDQADRDLDQLRGRFSRTYGGW